jgi:UDP-N-acetylmuramoylalanine--D-glutamate ligase
LNIHKDYAEYLYSKGNICRYQTTEDYCIYFKDNAETVKLVEDSKALKIPYPFEIPEEIRNAINLPGEHNINNAIAAIAAVASYKNISPDEYLGDYKTEIIAGLESFHGLPHRLEYLRELNGVKYYDDNFATNPSSTKVAVDAFPNDKLVVILGGRDKTNYEDLPEIYDILKAPQVKKVVLIGESGHELFNKYQDERFILAESLKEAIDVAKKEAENLSPSILMMSPAAASFDMFENVYDRGSKFKNLILSLN